MIDRITEQPFCQTRVSGSTFVNADCFDVFPFIEDKSIDAIICDLPYGTTACKWDSILPLDRLWIEYKRVLKDGGCLVFTGTQPFTTTLIASNFKMFKYELIWDKVLPTGFAIAKYQPMKQHENILIFGNGKTTYNPQKVKRDKPRTYNRTHKFYEGSENLQKHDGKDRVLEYYEPRSIQIFSNANHKTKQHPTEKPIELMEYLVKTYTNEGDTVLDNTMGSGTTNLACIKLNRKSIGIEKEKQYYEVAVRRASEYLGNDTYKNIQEKENYDKLLSSGMFWEFHPELSGNWDIDKEVVQYCH